MGIFSGLFKKDKNLVAHSKDLSMEEIEKIQLSLKDKMDADVYNSTFNQACRLIPKGQYTEAITLFTAIEENTTDAHEKGNCQNQIGCVISSWEILKRRLSFTPGRTKTALTKT